MNIVDAVKSGKPFRRKDDDNNDEKWWLIKDEMLTYEWSEKEGLPPGIDEENPSLWTYIGKDANYGMHLELEDIVADDWEIYEPIVTISKTQFWGAVKTSCSLQLTGPHVDATVLAEKLGLK